MTDPPEIPPPPAAVDREPMATVLLGALPMLAGLGSVTLLAGRGGGRMLMGLGALLLLAAAVAGIAARRQVVARARRVSDQRRDYREALEQTWSAILRAPLAGRLPAVVAGEPGRPRASIPPIPPVTPRADVVCARALRRLEARLALLRTAPGSVDLAEAPHLDLDDEHGPDRARAVVCDAAHRNDAEELRVEVLTDAEHRDEWAWVRWLPHARADAGAAPHRLVVLDRGDGVEPTPDDLAGAAVLRLRRPPSRGPASRGPHGASRHPTLTLAEAEALARRLAGRTAPRADAPLDLLAPAPDDRPLRVVLGAGPDGRPVHLDLAEAAEGGDGPHGLLVGATGSGKSELLRILVLGLVGRHPPDRLALALIDFKGGATFAGLEGVPHVAGLTTNLGDDLSVVDRLAEALGAEVAERQQRLHDAGGLPDLTSWDARVIERAGPPPPRLVVVIDELSELVTARPDIVPVLVALGRVGRSLGVHLLLASQRWDEGRLGGLEAHVSYRIALRTFSAAESRAAIGVPDAADLPQAPGHGLLRLGTSLLPFRAPAVSAPRRIAQRSPVEVDVPASDTSSETCTIREDPSTWESTLAGLRGASSRTSPVWVPPLLAPLDLRPLLSPDRASAPDLVVGARERPRGRGHEPLILRGHPLVVGARGSGVSTALRTLAWSALLQAEPTGVALVLLDLDDGGLAPLATLPQVVGRATRAEEVPAALASLDDRQPGRPALVLVDGWARVRDHPRAADAVLAVIDDGARQDVRVALGARRWADLRPAVRDLLGAALELRLADPTESLVDRRRASSLRRDRPGHGLDEEGHEVLVAVMPTESDMVESLGRRHRVAPLDLAGWLATAPAPWDLEIRGPSGSGRSTALAIALRRQVGREPDQVRIVLLRSAEHLRADVPPSMLLPWDHDDPADGARQLIAHLADRATRAGAAGPDVVVVADEPAADEASVLEALRGRPAGLVVLVVASEASTGRPAADVTTRLDLAPTRGHGRLRRPGRPTAEIRVSRPP